MWEEAPVLGNHWLLVGMVDLVILLAAAVAALRRRGNEPAEFANRVFPAARLCLLGFYVFASFAKLNSAFFDRSTSCAVFYFDEATDSVGLSSLQLDGAAWLQWSVIVGTAAVELSIPVLLVVRRTRHIGVVVGLLFHGVLAIDRTHQFFDFSSVLAALFVLFLPAIGGGVGRGAGRIGAGPAGAARRSPAARGSTSRSWRCPRPWVCSSRSTRSTRADGAGPRLVAVAPLPHRLPRRDASLSAPATARARARRAPCRTTSSSSSFRSSWWPTA